MAPPWIPVPPPSYGGTESVVDNLARGLTARGHDVTLFTVGTSTVPVERRSWFDEPVAPMGLSIPEAVHVLAAHTELAEVADVDVIHDHTVLGPLLAPAAGPGVPPLVTTNHGVYNAATRLLFGRAAERASVVAISADQARRAEGRVPIARVIHHGVDTDTYRAGSGGGEHLVFVGRMSPEKGVDRAVRIARAAGRPLRIFSKMRDETEVDYYESHVRPLLAADERPLFEAGLDERVQCLQTAAGLLNPIAWPEPFGLVMAESLAVGTPVITWPLGAAPEIITHGRTGFLCATEDAAVRAVTRLPEIDRAVCRAEAEERFSVARMAADHEDLYACLVARSRQPSRRNVAVTGAHGGTATSMAG
ncbi:glycosyltransferase family 4 protein [Nocardioides rubriscoriae]|uniref:glycosyltransferase family 4 protein n=1 Tax=Nocardioides rubriscoriae TaxID=642762 RepID=UPI001B883C19|nr:glycosyltransferase family 4 protein [Nocardioides rubriscoriae]